jgi:hypothetical protein
LLSVLPEVIAQTCDPEIEWHEDPQRADGRVYRGHDGVRESFERWLDQWDEYGTEAERFVLIPAFPLAVGASELPAGRPDPSVFPC